MARLNLLDVFSGAGGLSLGFNQENFNIVTAVENWMPAYDTYKHSHQNNIKMYHDAYDFVDGLNNDHNNYLKRGDIDVLIGGPPCQGFCGMNRYRHIEDERNSLVEVYFQIVQILQPKIVIMENVTGIMSLGDGLYLKQFLDALTGLGYTADFCVLQAGYYGVPQNRWRVIVFAINDTNSRIKFPQPVHEFHKTAVHNAAAFKRKVIYPISDGPSLFYNPLRELNVFDAIGDLPEIKNGDSYHGEYLKVAKTGFQKIIRENSNLVLNHNASKVGELHLERFKHIPKNKPNSGWLDLPDNLKPKNLTNFSSGSYDNRFGRLNWNGTFNSIMAKVEPYWGRVIHPENDRLISVRETARAQGYPDNVEFHGSMSDMFRMIGNSVPPPMARAISASVLDNLNVKNCIMEQYVNDFQEMDNL
jgi:DNA (cytosine-5)-methyltransferase 1